MYTKYVWHTVKYQRRMRILWPIPPLRGELCGSKHIHRRRHRTLWTFLPHKVFAFNFVASALSVAFLICLTCCVFALCWMRNKICACGKLGYTVVAWTVATASLTCLCDHWQQQWERWLGACVAGCAQRICIPTWASTTASRVWVLWVWVLWICMCVAVCKRVEVATACWFAHYSLICFMFFYFSNTKPCLISSSPY